MAVKLAEDHKWLSPRVLENTPLEHEGRTLTFTQWVGEILHKNDRARSDGIRAASKLTPIEEKAIELGERFSHYRAIREHNSPAAKPLDLRVVPRPFDDTHRKYSTKVFEKGMNPEQTLSPLEANVANTLVEYLEGLQSKDWALPGVNGAFDQKFGVWLNEHSNWMPLGIMLDSDISELSRAGWPICNRLRRFRKSHRDSEGRGARGARECPRGRRGRRDRHRT